MWHDMLGKNRRILIGAAGLVVCAVVVACSVVQRGNAPQQTVDAARQTDEAAVTQAGDAKLREVEATPPKVEQPLPPKRPAVLEPLSPEAIAALRDPIEAASDDFGSRLEARRGLFHALRKHGQLDLAMAEFDAMLDDVERTSGLAMAQRVAIADAGNIHFHKDYPAAIAAYERLLLHYGDGRFAAEATHQLGLCHIEMQDYVAAGEVFRHLIEEHDDSHLAPLGWRKLALVQTLQGRFDAALATLEIMAGKYGGTHHGEYARMRRGYVQMAAGRFAEARTTYEAFLANHPHSKYRRLVTKQMAELDGASTLARANP